MFRLLDRYVIREMIGPFTIGLIASTFVLEVPVILRYGEDLLAKGVEGTVILRVLFDLLPQALSLTIPMSLLLGILVAFGRLSADREFVAMQACGVTLMRLLRPVAFVSVLATAATAYETIIALPNGNQSFREITFGVGASKIERSIRPGVFFEDIANIVIYAKELPPEGGLRGVFLADSREPGRTQIHFAREGRIRLDRERLLAQLELKGVTSDTTYADRPDEVDRNEVEVLTTYIDPKTIFPDPPAKGPPEMTLAELQEAVAADRQMFAERRARGENPYGEPGIIHRFMYQQKLALPLTCPILALIGLALGASNRRDGKLASFVLGFGVILVYYVLMFTFRALAHGNRFNPDWGPWMPNIIMGTAAILLLLWRKRAADQPIRLSMPVFWRRRRPAELSLSGAEPEAETPRRDRVVLVIRVPHFHVPAPRILDLYVSREYWRVVLLAFCALLGIFYVSTFIDLADKLFRGSATLAMVARYFYYRTPQFAFFILPMSVLVSTLVTIAVMTKNSELIVMRACGVSLYRTALPLLLFAAMVGGTLFLLQERVLPTTNRETDRLNRLIRGQPPLTSPYNQRWIVSRSGDFYHYDLLDARANRFTNFKIYHVDHKQWGLRGMTSAKTVDLAPGAIDGGSESPVMPWNASQGWVRTFSRTTKSDRPDGKKQITVEPFQTKALPLEGPEYFASKPQDTDDMSYDEMLTYRELQAYIEQLRASGSDVVSYTVALRRKIAFPFVTIVMTLLAVPFAVSTGRRGALYGIGAGLMLAITYFIMMSVFAAFGTVGQLSPTMAAWAPNVIFTAAALYLVLTVKT